jgi:hypothetical protein
MIVLQSPGVRIPPHRRNLRSYTSALESTSFYQNCTPFPTLYEVYFKFPVSDGQT